MKKNLSSVDRAIRVMFAVIVAGLYFSGILTGTFGVIMMIIGIILAITSVINFCPIYYALGISSNKEVKHS